MILIATGSLTVLHPGLCFQGQWKSQKQSLGSIASTVCLRMDIKMPIASLHGSDFQEQDKGSDVVASFV